MNEYRQSLDGPEFDSLPRETAAELHRQGTPEARGLLISSCLRFAIASAKPFFAPGLDRDELIEEANIQVIRAVDAWNPSQGALTTLVGTYVTNGIRQYLRERSPGAVYIPFATKKIVSKLRSGELTHDDLSNRTPRRRMEIAQAQAIMEGMLPVEDRYHPCVDDTLEPPANCVADIDSMLIRLPDQQRQVVRRRYGLGKFGEPQSFAEIAEALGILENEVGKLLTQAIARLQQQKLCQHCGKPFKVHRSTKIFCSRRCAVGAYYRRVMSKKYPLRRRCRTCKKKFVISTPMQHMTIYCSPKCVGELATCKQCNKEFVRSRKHIQFCSNECVGKHLRRPTRTCKHCSKEFQPRREKSVFCCRSCKARSVGRAIIPSQVCPRCKNVFQPKKKGMKCCTKKCAAKMPRRSWSSIPKRPCEFCQEVFQPKRTRNRFCSRKCSASGRPLMSVAG